MNKIPELHTMTFEQVAVSQLKPHPENPRQGNVNAIQQSITENGFYGALVVQRSTGYVLAGNHRLKAAKRAGLKQVPVLWVDVDDWTAKRILIADNRASDLAGYQESALSDLLAQIQAQQGDLTGTLFSPVDLTDIGYHMKPAGLGVFAARRDEHIDESAFYALKQDPDAHPALFARARDDLVDLIRRWQPNLPTSWTVTCPPAGASASQPVYFAERLAQEVAFWLGGLPFVPTLKRRKPKRSHHVIRSLKQAEGVLEPLPYEVIEAPMTPCLVIDDRCTTGTTMRYSLECLRAYGVPAFGFVWVGH